MSLPIDYSGSIPASTGFGVLRSKDIPSAIYKISESLTKSLIAVTLPVIDKLGRELQIFQMKGYGIIGLVKDPSGRQSIVSKHKISSPICPGISSDELMIRLQGALGTVWDIIYKQASGEFIIFPHLEAAGKRGFVIRPIKKGNHNPVGHLNRDQLREMYIAKGYKLCRHHVDAKSDYEIYANDKFKHIIDYRNKYNEIPHIDVYRLRDSQFFKDYPPHPSYGKDQLKARFAIKSDGKTGDNPPPNKSQPIKQFHETLQKTGLTKSYNSTHPENPAPEKRGTTGEIGGVGSAGDYIEGLFDTPESLLESAHAFLIPQINGDEHPFSQDELHQILNELAIGIYLHDTVPFFSLHFNQNGDLYPVIHPAYEKTLVGQVFSMLDYMMKGYLNGGVFEEPFVYAWSENQGKNDDIRETYKKMINFEEYCRVHLNGGDQEYHSLNQMLSHYQNIVGGDQFGEFYEKLKKVISNDRDESSKIFNDFNKFTNSFRIIAYQERVQKSENLFVLNSNFKVQYTIEPNPEYQLALERFRKKNGSDPEGYQFLTQTFKEFGDKIHDHFIKFPICKKYFSMLGVINFFSLYFKTLKKHGKYPLLPTPHVKPLGCPSLFPSLPQHKETKETLKFNLKLLGEDFICIFKQQLEDVLDQENPSEETLKTISLRLVFLIKEQIISNASIVMKPMLTLKSIWLDELCTKIEQELNLVGLVRKGYRDFLNDYQNGWIATALELKEEQFKNVFLSGFQLNHRFVELPVPFPVFVSSSELTTEERIKGRKIVGGCGMVMNSLKVEAIPNESDILNLVLTKLNSDIPTTLHKIDRDDLGRIKGVVFNLPFMEIPFDPTENRDEMEKLLLAPTLIDTSMLIQMKLMLNLMNENRKDAFETVLRGLDPLLLKDQSGQHLLHYAVTNDDIFFAKKLIDAGVPVNLKDPNGYTSLHHAAAKGCIRQIEFLLGKDKDLVRTKNHYHATALFVAIQNKKKEAAEFLIANGSSLQDETKEGYTIFHTAAFSDDLEIMKLILEKTGEVGNRLDQTTQEGMTPLMIAVGSSFEMAKLLGAAGANVKLVAKNGETALDMAINRNDINLCRLLIPHSQLSPITIERAIRKCNLELNRLLVSMKGYYEIVNPLEDSALLIALRYANIPFALELIDLKSGIRFLNHQNLLKESAIYLAAQAGFYEVVEKLLSKGVEINCVELLGLLLRSGYTGNYESIQTYLNRGVYQQEDLQKLILISVNAGNHVGITKCLLPLNADLRDFEGGLGWKIEHYLARSDGIYLLRRQSDLKNDPLMPLKADGKRTLLYIAAQNSSLRVLEYLLTLANAINTSFESHYLDRHLFWAVIESGNLESIKLCLDLIKNVDLLNIPLDGNHTRAVHLAAKMGLTDVVEFLFQKGANLSLTDLHGNSTLYYAIQSQDSDCVDFICKHQNKFPVTSEEIYLAACKHDSRIFERLIKANANLEIRSLVNEMTPVMLAIQGNNMVAFDRLLKAGASLRLITKEGWTPFLLAAQSGNLPLLEIVLNKTLKEFLKHVVNGSNALHLAVRKGDGECIQFLLNNGFSTDDETTDGRNAFEVATGLEALAALGHKRMVSLYKKMQILVSGAISSRSLDAINYWVDRLDGFEFDFTNSQIQLNLNGTRLKGTPLQLLIELCGDVKGLKEVVKKISSKKGFDPTLKNSKGLSYAHILILNGIDPTQFQNIDLEAVDNDGKTVLHYAAQSKFHDILRTLIQKFGPAKINVVDKEGRTPIFEAVKEDQRDNITYLYEKGADLNIVDQSGLSPIGLATLKRNLIVVKLLIKYGANFNETNSIKEISPLALALELKLEELCLYLLHSGFNLKKAQNKGVHLVHLAASLGKLSIIRFFAARGIAINVKDEKGLEPVHYAASKGKVRILEELKSYGIDLESKSKEPRIKRANSIASTPLEVAAEWSKVETVKWFLEQGVNMNENHKSKYGVLFHAMNNDQVTAESIINELKNYRLIEDVKVLMPAITRCIMQDYLGPLKEFLKMGISLETTLEGGNTLLHIACMAGAYHITQFLLDQGVNIMAVNSAGATPLELAAANRSAEQFHLMLKHVNVPLNNRNQRGETLLHIAASNRKLSHIAMIIEQKAHLNIQDVVGKTALFIAAENGYEDIVDLLILCGADSMLGTTFNLSYPHQVCNDKIRLRIEFLQAIISNAVPESTFLHIAARYGTALSVKLNCIRFEIDQQNEMGATALHEAVRSGKNENVRALIMEDADIHAVDKQGNTPLAIACLEIKNKSIIRLLMDSNDDPVRLEQDKKSILDKARQIPKLFDFLELILSTR